MMKNNFFEIWLMVFIATCAIVILFYIGIPLQVFLLIILISFVVGVLFYELSKDKGEIGKQQELKKASIQSRDEN